MMTDPAVDDVAAYDPEVFFEDRRRAAELATTIAEFRGMGLGPKAARSHVANQAKWTLPEGVAS